MFMSHHYNTRQNRYLMTDNKSSENMAKFKYFGMTVANKNPIPREIMCRLI